MSAILAKLWKRVRAITGTIHPEAVELLSIGYAISWILPLIRNPWFMNQSPFLATVEEHLPRPCLLALCLSLLLYQVTALLMGGEPPILETGRRRARAWLWVRLWGQLAAAGIWFFLALLLSGSGVLTPGTVQYILVAIACAAGVWRFYFLVRENRNIEKQVQDMGAGLLAKG